MKYGSALLTLVLLYTANASIAAVIPEKGTFEGVYHRDRSGVGRFSDFHVHPKLHDKLANVQGKRIRLEVLKARQPINPGPSLIHEIGGHTLLEEDSLGFEVSVVPLVKKDDECALVIWLINQKKRQIELSLQGLTVGLYRPRKVAHPEKSSILVPYTNAQMATRKQIIQWLNNHLVNQRNAFERGHHVSIGPDERFPVVTFVKDPPWPLEILVKCPVGIGSETTYAAEAWYSLKRPVPGKPLSQPPSVSASDVSLSKYEGFPPLFVPDGKSAVVDPGQRMSFLLKPQGDKAVKIVSCSKRANLIAGTIATKSGQMLEVLPTYSCNNLGEPWILTTLPKEGLKISLVTEKVAAKSYELRLLTEHGLETVHLPVDP